MPRTDHRADPASIDAGPADALLRVAYDALDYSAGTLLDAADRPAALGGAGEDAERGIARWTDVGDWLTLAARMGAERLFFVGSDPIIVFRTLPDGADEAAVAEAYRQAWCMAGPLCLFLSLPGELRVYALTNAPIAGPNAPERLQALEVVGRAADVAERLAAFARDRVESGALFGDKRFANAKDRADRRLVRDLRLVRGALARDLAVPFAHALIGRSIFIRYLEDRGVLTRAYFEERIVARHPEQAVAWQRLLDEVPAVPDLAPRIGDRLYERVLRDHGFTYALFEALAGDFNGDLFPSDEAEARAVTGAHLKLLRDFLLGVVRDDQPALFLWAYDFRIVPISLISSIYEEFYHTEESGADDDDQDDEDNTHYTPSTLVDDVLTRVLTPERLALAPRVLDPACGSGIFLVEAYRRIVRFETARRGPLGADALRDILRRQIAGIELNPEATRVAAFSLYLALLNYQEPPEILAGPPLPHVVYVGVEDERHYSVLVTTNAFTLTARERTTLENRLAAVASGPLFNGRAASERLLRRLLDGGDALPFELGTFDVVIGNPPWQEARRGRPAERAAAEWGEAFNLPVGDRSYSQLFIHRALSLVRPDGVVGLLVSAKVIWNQRRTSREFRAYWLDHAHVHEVVNFTHARRVFFPRGAAPFVMARFQPRRAESPTGYVVYFSARRTDAAVRIRSVTFSHADRRLVRQSDLRADDTLWKTYWWGSHRDAALVARLGLEDRLSQVLKFPRGLRPTYGFQRGGGVVNDKSRPDGLLATARQLESERITWYGPLQNKWFADPPRTVKRRPDERLYQGARLLVTTGVKSGFGPCVRLERDPFTFRHTIYCVPVRSLKAWQAELVLGILWSSLGRYRTFMTSGGWAGWYDKVTAVDVLTAPVRVPEAESSVTRPVTDAVGRLRAWVPDHQRDLLGQSVPPRARRRAGAGGGGRAEGPPSDLTTSLDRAVYDLFELSEAERDLVNDFFRYGFDLLEHGPSSPALKPVEHAPALDCGTAADLGNRSDTEPGLSTYMRAFLARWNPELKPDGAFRWRVMRSPGSAMLAVVFETVELEAAVARERGPRPAEAHHAAVPDAGGGHGDADAVWPAVLARCAQALRVPVSRAVAMDGVIRAVTPTSITILKRNERRLWTPSAAREDAEATLLQAMHLEPDRNDAASELATV